MRYLSKIWLIVDRRNRLLHIDPNRKRVTMETIHRFKILPIRGIFLLSRDTGHGGEEEQSISLWQLGLVGDYIGEVVMKGWRWSQILFAAEMAAESE